MMTGNIDIFKRELEARETAGWSTVNKGRPSAPKLKQREDGTTHALLTGGDVNCPTCTFCKGKHPSRDCQTVPDVVACKRLLKKYGRCFVCLRKDHTCRNCSAKFKCHNCKGRDHVSICPANLSPFQPINPETPVPTPGPQQQCLMAQSTSNSVVFHTDSTAGVCLQPARAMGYNPQQSEVKVKARIVLDRGSQRTYITNNLKNILQLPTLEKKQVSIKTFRSTVERLEVVDVVALGEELNREPDLSLSAFTLPLICQPLQGQPVEQAVRNNPCLSGLKPADFCTKGETLGVNILAGLDYYWK